MLLLCCVHWCLWFVVQKLCVFDVNCVPSSCGRMGLSGFLYTVPLTLMAISIIMPATGVAYNSLTLHYSSSIYGELNCTYDLNVSSTTPVSIFYNESHHQVIAIYFLHLFTSPHLWQFDFYASFINAFTYLLLMCAWLNVNEIARCLVLSCQLVTGCGHDHKLCTRHLLSLTPPSCAKQLFPYKLACYQSVMSSSRSQVVSSDKVPDCSVRDPMIRSCCVQCVCLWWKPLWLYTLGHGCTPLL